MKRQACFVAFGLFMLHIFNNLSTGKAQVVMQCPEKFKDGEINLISCTIDGGFQNNGVCLKYPPPFVTFANMEPNAANETLRLCNVDWNSECSETLQVQEDQCGCTGSSGLTKTMTFAFRADKERDTGLKYLCDVCPGGSLPAPANPCDSVQFDGAGSVKSSLLGTLVLVTAALLLKNWAPGCL